MSKRKKNDLFLVVLILTLIAIIMGSVFKILTISDPDQNVEQNGTDQNGADQNGEPESSVDVLFPSSDIKYAITTLISGAESNILIIIDDFTIPEIADALIDRKQRKNTGGGNVEVQILFHSDQPSTSQYWTLREIMPTRTISLLQYRNSEQLYNIVIIDNYIVIVGNFNWDDLSVGNIIIITDKSIAEKYTEIFNSAWKKGGHQ